VAWSAVGAFLLLVVATAVCYFVKANGLGFFSDDWEVAQRGGSFGDYFQPYNGSLLVVPLAIYRALYAVFGFHTPLPLRLVGVLSGAAIAVAMFFVVRARVGTALALAAGSILLWYPNFRVAPATFDHYLALTAIIVCAWLLTRDGSAADLTLALVLTFALCNSGIGVAGGVGVVAYVALARAPRSRWVAVVLPMAAWTMWWLFISERTSADDRSPSAMFNYVVEGIKASFRGLAFDNRVLAVVLAAAFVVTLCWRLRKGLQASRNQVAWTVALFAWWVALAYSRGSVVEPHTFRYALAGSAFVILAFLPTRATTWRMLDRPIALAAGVVFAVLVVVVNHGSIFESQRQLGYAYDHVRSNLIVGNLDPAVVPDRVELFLGGPVPLTAGEYRRLVAKFGTPPGTRPRNLDASVVALNGVRPVLTRTSPSGHCVELARTSPLPAGATVTLRAGAHDVPVRLRRFEDAPTDVGSIPADSTTFLRLPGPNGIRPWILEAPGACRVVDAHVTITRPRPKSRLSGSTVLAATTSGDIEITSVDFRLTRNDNSVTVIPAKRSLVGWVAELDASQLSNGAYTITSTATDETGDQTVSAGVPVTVDH
jgi:hypothetical protein